MLMVTRQLKKKSQTGAAAVEFALVSVLFFSLLVGFFEFGLLLLRWNSAVQATTMGARTAAVCSRGSQAPVDRMESILSGVSPAVVIEYLDVNGSSTTACNSTVTNVCYQVRARLDGTKFQSTFSTPLLSKVFNVPSFTTVIPAERLNSAGNPDCS